MGEVISTTARAYKAVKEADGRIKAAMIVLPALMLAYSIKHESKKLERMDHVIRVK